METNGTLLTDGELSDKETKDKEAKVRCFSAKVVGFREVLCFRKTRRS